MRGRASVWGRGAPVAVAVLLLAGCGGQAAQDSAAVKASARASAASSSAAASPSTGSSSKSSTSKSSTLSNGDQRACAGAESLVGHLTAVTARWSPQRRPFDPKIRQDIATFAGNLAAQRQFAQTAPVRAAISDNATSFTGMAAAMTEHNRRHVTRAISDVRVHYKRLKRICAINN